LSISEGTSIENNILRSNTWGAYLSTNDIRITGNVVENNIFGIFVRTGQDDIRVHHNRFSGNSKLGLDAGISDTNDIDAVNNWWGSDHGPYNPDKNPNGKGDNITHYVLFDPWIGKDLAVKYVDDNAPEGGNGTEQRPYTTIQTAVDDVLEEGVIYIWDGTYHESVIINRSMIVYGNGSSAVTINGDGVNVPMTITANNVNLSGVKCTNSGSGSEKGGIMIRSDTNHVFNVSCVGNGGFGFGLFNGKLNSFHDILASGNAGEGGRLEHTSRHYSHRTHFL